MAKQDSHKFVKDMAYKYRWLSQALDDMSHEIGYVYAEFGEKSARKAESVLRQRVDYLCTFPNLGMNYEGLTFRGNEVRIMHIKKVSIIYCVEDDVITLIAIWNNRRDENTLETMIKSRQ